MDQYQTDNFISAISAQGRVKGVFKLNILGLGDNELKTFMKFYFKTEIAVKLYIYIYIYMFSKPIALILRFFYLILKLTLKWFD